MYFVVYLRLPDYVFEKFFSRSTVYTNVSVTNLLSVLRQVLSELAVDATGIIDRATLAPTTALPAAEALEEGIALREEGDEERKELEVSSRTLGVPNP